MTQLTAPGGTLLVIAAIHDRGSQPQSGPPSPLTRPELDAFATNSLTPQAIEMAAIHRIRPHTTPLARRVPPTKVTRRSPGNIRDSDSAVDPACPFRCVAALQNVSAACNDNEQEAA